MNSTSSADSLNVAVVAYIGLDMVAAPALDMDRLQKVVGPITAQALMPRVRALVAELDALEVDWSQHTLESAGQWAAQTMGARHPELSEEALRALAWKFTFDWR